MSQNQYKMSIRPKRRKLKEAKSKLVLMMTFFAIAILTSYLRFLSKTWGPVLFLSSLFAFFGLLSFYLYIRGLLEEEKILEFSQAGVYDGGSLLRLGAIKAQDLAGIKLIRAWSFTWLELRLPFGSSPWKAFRLRQPWLSRIYTAVFGTRTYIPLSYMDISRFDLETQLIHFKGGGFGDLSHLRDSESSASGSVDGPPAIRQNRSSANSENEMGRILRGQDISADSENFNKDQNLYTPAKPEHEPVVLKVLEIQSKVRVSGFDKRMCDLYFEAVRFFPRWFSDQSSRLPAGVLDVRSTLDEAVYEEVDFKFQGTRFTFGLRRGINSEETEALLSIGFQGRVVMSLKVQVEIGELEPLQLEQFIEGPWEALLESLQASVAAEEKKSTGLRLKVNQEDSHEPSPLTDDKVEDLKKKFGLSD